MCSVFATPEVPAIFQSRKTMLNVFHSAFWVLVISLFFFFTSRRRHTRSLCDWSSDVCSSDLHPSGGKNVRAFAGLHRGADFKPHRMDDVALLAIGVMQQRDVRAAIGVIFDGRNFCRHTDFFAPEIHLAVLLLVAAAAMPNHNFAVIVSSAGSLFRLKQGFLRLLLGDMAFVQDGDKPPRRRIWIKAFKSHRRLLPSYFLLQRNAVCAYKFSAYSIIFSPSASFT